MKARIDKRQVEALKRFRTAANHIRVQLDRSLERRPHIDPSYDVSREEAARKAAELVQWLDDCVTVAEGR